MKIAAVTGSKGLVGRYLVRQLADSGWNVRALTRSEVGESPHVDSFVQGDLFGDPQKLEDFCRGATAVFHCAGEVSDESKMIETNVLATERICAAAAACSSHLVHVSSVGVYGRPISSTVDESAQIAPKNFYESTKAASERVVHRWGSLGLSYNIAQPTTILAADMPNDSIRALARAVHRGWFVHFAQSGATANYILASDVARSLVALGDGQMEGTYILNDPVPAESFIGAVRRGVGNRENRIPRMPLTLGLGLGLIGEWVPYVPVTRDGVRAFGSKSTYDPGAFVRATGLTPAGDILAELSAIAEQAVTTD